MPKIKYKSCNFTGLALDVIGKAEAILSEYAAQGFDMTLRQVYYKLIARDLFPDDRRYKWIEATRRWARDPNGTKNALPNYKWLSTLLNDGRLAGEIDWLHMCDRTRLIRGLNYLSGPQELLEQAERNYHLDKWSDQECRIEVWIEKDALVGVIEGVCRRLSVDYFSCRGYTGQSAMWQAGQRLKGYIEAGQTPVVFHLGDHDPSGVDMSRDILSRLARFIGSANVKRLALTMAQIREIDPPPSPAKLSDTRAGSYIAEFGYDSWELDALEPDAIAKLITENVLALRDDSKWNAQCEREREDKARIADVADIWDALDSRFDEVRGFLED